METWWSSGSTCNPKERRHSCRRPPSREAPNSRRVRTSLPPAFHKCAPLRGGWWTATGVSPLLDSAPFRTSRIGAFLLPAFALPYVIVALIALGIAVAQAGIGGVSLLYSLPAYGVIGLAAVASLFEHSKRISVGVRVPCLISAILVAGYVIVRSHFAPVDYLARNDFFMTLAALTVYLLSAVFLSGSRQRMLLIGILLVFAAAHLVYGVFQFLSTDGQYTLFAPWIVRKNNPWRASGFYLSPNHLAGLLEALGLMASALACWSNWHLIARMLAGYAAMLCFTGIAITGSRGGYLSTLAGLLVFAGLSLGVIGRLRPLRFLPTLAAVLMLFIAAIGGGVTLMSKSQTLRDRLGLVLEPDTGRLVMWDAAVRQFATSPLIGTGSGTYLFQGRQFRANPVQHNPAHVYNDYLELLCEYGIAGAGAMALFLGVHLWSSIAGLRRIVAEMEDVGWGVLNHELALLLGALSGIAALLVHSVFDCNLHVPGNTLVIAFFFSILAAPTLETLLPEENAEPSPAVHWLRFLAPAIGLYLLVVGVPRVEGEYYSERARIAFLGLDYESAAGFAQKGIVVEKKNPNLFCHLGKAKYELAHAREPAATDRFYESHEVIGAFRAGLELFPQDIWLLLALGHALDQYGQFAEAGRVFERAIAADPTFHFSHASFGLHFQMQGKMDDAMKHYRRAIVLGEPADGPAANALRQIARRQDEAGPRPSPDVDKTSN